MEKENLKKFVISLYKPVKCLTIVMIVSMIISQILDLVFYNFPNQKTKNHKTL